MTPRDDVMVSIFDNAFLQEVRQLASVSPSPSVASNPFLSIFQYKDANEKCR